MVNNNQQFLIQNEEFNKNFIFPSVKNINTQQVISLYENFKKILPHTQKYSKDVKVRRNLSDILDEFDVLFLDALASFHQHYYYLILKLSLLYIYLNKNLKSFSYNKFII